MVEDKANKGTMMSKKWLKGFTCYLVLAGSWVLAPVYYGFLASGMASRTRGGSLGCFGVMFLDGWQRKLWVALLLAAEAAVGPRRRKHKDFVWYWNCWAQTAAIFGISYFAGRFKPWPRFMAWIYDLKLGNYHYNGCELRGALEDIKDKNSLFGFHPHGILTAGFACNGCWSKEFHELCGGTTRTKFLIDKRLREDNCAVKILAEWHGGAETLNKPLLHRFMSQGLNVAFVPGGFEDATLHEYGVHRTVIKKRSGFIKYALQYGVRVHPVYTFGECDTHYTINVAKRLRLWVNQFGVPAAIFFGFPLVPAFPMPSARILTYVGKAIEFPRIAEPTNEEVVKWHQVYMDALIDLFEKNKVEAGYPNATLEIC